MRTRGCQYGGRVACKQRLGKRRELRFDGVANDRVWSLLPCLVLPHLNFQDIANFCEFFVSTPPPGQSPAPATFAASLDTHKPYLADPLAITVTARTYLFPSHHAACDTKTSSLMKLSTGNVPVYTVSGSEARPLPDHIIRRRKRCPDPPLLRGTRSNSMKVTQGRP